MALTAGGVTVGQEEDAVRDRDRLRDQDQDGLREQDRVGTQDGDASRTRVRSKAADKNSLLRRIRTKTENKATVGEGAGVMGKEENGLGEPAGIATQDGAAYRLRAGVPGPPEAVTWPGYRLPDLRIGRWWYKPAPRVGKEVDLYFEIQNVGRRVARGPILWEVTNHNWGFWNPVLNRIAVSYSGRWLVPGQSRVIHIRFRMTRRTHNLRFMVDPSDRLGPPDNPPFGQKAKLYGWRSLKNGHIWESNERNNAKWVCIKIFPLEPAEITTIEIPVINPFPGVPTPVVLEMDKELAIPNPILVGLPKPEVASLGVTDAEPVIEPVEPGQVISEFTFEDSDEEVVVLLAKLYENAALAEPVQFRVLATATGPDGEPIFAEVTVVLEVESSLDETPLPLEEVWFR